MTRGDQSPIRTLPNRIQRSGHRDMIMALAGCSLLKPIEEELKRTSKNDRASLKTGARRPVAQRPWKSDWIAAPIGPATLSKEIRRFGERLKRHRPRNRALDTVTREF
jgi:hypothetical protein